MTSNLDYLIGQEIKRYRIIESLGAGGMGVVFKAEDLRLKRPVALKFLPSHLQNDPGAIERFIAEAQSASALDHPNICTIYEIDEFQNHTFISMAYYDGKTIRELVDSGPLDLQQSIDIVIQIVEGLSAAHTKKIIHRDIKPGNVIVREDRRVKIIDFGLSKLMGVTSLTKTGQTLGTLGYMAPEQVENREVDHRADLWAAIVLFYEMVTGEAPFKADYEVGMIYSILNEEPLRPGEVNPALPREIDIIIEKGLSKDAGERYQSAEALIEDLKRLKESPQKLSIPMGQRIRRQLKALPNRTTSIAGAIALILGIVVGILFLPVSAPEGAERSLAVLPMRGFAEAEGDVLWTDGMTDELLTSLQKISGIRVVSQNSVNKYKDSEKSMTDIADELNVSYLVEASVYKIDNQIKISARLINGKTNEYIWSTSMEENIRDIFSLHSKLSKNISREIEVELTPQEEKLLASSKQVDPKAYTFYLSGRNYLAHRNDNSLQKAITFFEEALVIDSTFAAAYTGLAATYFWASMGYLKLPPKTAFENILVNANMALKYDTTAADAYLALAIAQQRAQNDFGGAEESFKKALQLNPNSALAKEYYALQLMVMGEFDESLKYFDQAQQLDPASASIVTEAGWVYYYQRRYDKAMQQFRRAVELDPKFPVAQFNIGITYDALGEYDKAVVEYKKALEVQDGYHWKSYLGKALAMAGNDKEAREVLEELLLLEKQNYNVLPGIGLVYMGMAEYDKAFEYWFRAVEEGHPTFLLVAEPTLDPVREDPRFAKLVERHFFK